MNSFESPGWSVALRAGLAAAVLFAGGCKPNEQAPPPIDDRGPCAAQPVKGGDEVLTFNTQQAEKCNTFMHGGTVYVMNFAGAAKPEEAEEFAKNMQKQIKGASQGLFDLVVKVVDAPPAAEELLKKDTPNGCVANHYTAHYANETMPELDEPSIKVGLSAIPSCTKGLRGISDAGGNYVDIFWGSIPESTRLKEAVFTAVHEFFHNVMIGHDGAIYRLNKDGSRTLFKGEKLRELDLKAYLELGQYEEYGSNPRRVQGFPNYAADFTLDPIHLNMLRWPQITLQGEQISREQRIGRNEATITPGGAGEGRFISATLDGSTVLKDLSLEKDLLRNRSHEFNKVVFRPVVETIKGAPVIRQFELCVVSTDANIATLGRLSVDSEPTDIFYGDQRFQVLLQGSSLNVIATTR